MEMLPFLTVRQCGDRVPGPPGMGHPFLATAYERFWRPRVVHRLSPAKARQIHHKRVDAALRRMSRATSLEQRSSPSSSWTISTAGASIVC